MASNKVDVIHPGKQMSYYFVEMLYRHNLLCKFYTSIFYSKERMEKSSKLPSYIRDMRLKRSIKDLPQAYIYQTCKFRSYACEFVARTQFGKLYDKLNNSLNRHFNKRILDKVINDESSIILSCSNNTIDLFKKVKEKSDKVCVLDMPILSHENTRLLFEEALNVETKYNPIEEFKLFLKEKENSSFKNEFLYADYILAPSSIQKEYLLNQGINENQIKVIHYHNYIDPSLRENRYFFKKDGKIKVIYVGNVTGRKGIHLLIEELSSFLGSSLELFLVGKYNQKLKETYSSFKGVNFLGPKNKKEVFDFLSKSDLFIFPSLSDGFGNALVEAMSVDLPILSSKYAGASDLIEKKYVFDPLNKGQLKEMIQMIIDDRNLLKEMSESSKKQFIDYSKENYEEEFISFINKISLERVK